ncbi:MAG: hypothetical protein ABSH05_12070, partial [Bryobacteraceae bacterium]
RAQNNRFMIAPQSRGLQVHHLYTSSLPDTTTNRGVTSPGATRNYRALQNAVTDGAMAQCATPEDENVFEGQPATA